MSGRTSTEHADSQHFENDRQLFFYCQVNLLGHIKANFDTKHFDNQHFDREHYFRQQSTEVGLPPSPPPHRHKHTHTTTLCPVPNTRMERIRQSQSRPPDDGLLA